MLAVFLLISCVICGETLGFEYFDELYSYDDDDEEFESTPDPGGDLARERRDPHFNRTLTFDPEEFQDPEGDLEKIMITTITHEADYDKGNTTVDLETKSILRTPRHENDAELQKGNTLTTNKIYSSEYKNITRCNAIINNSYTNSEYDKSNISWNIQYNRTRKIRGQDEFIREKLEELQALGKRYQDTTKFMDRSWLRPATDPPFSTTFKQNFESLDPTVPTRSSPDDFGDDETVYDDELDQTTAAIKPRTSVNMNINNFLDVISNLTYDYYSNLTGQILNKTVERMATSEVTDDLDMEEMDPFELARTALPKPVAKCYVCGLEYKKIPRTAYCADAFAGNSMSVFPINPRSRKYIERYRIACQYEDSENYTRNASFPRAIFGRFTGGCTKRWADITGMYTQRTCRNRLKPVRGRHFASKRMAALERMLKHKKNGCVVSPAASLLPLSRAISLYARFHACVCTGTYCNTAFWPDSDVWMTSVIVVTAVLFSRLLFYIPVYMVLFIDVL